MQIIVRMPVRPIKKRLCLIDLEAALGTFICRQPAMPSANLLGKIILGSKLCIVQIA
jgi:hypothetical protein